MNLSRDFARITESLQKGQPVEVPLKELGGESEHFVRGLVTKATAYLESPHLDTTLQLIISELLKNAEKAVAKRIFLRENKLDPANAGEADLKRFARTLREDSAALRTTMQKLSHIALCRFSLSPEGLNVEVENPGLPFPDEENRIKEGIRMGGGLSLLAEIDRAPLGSAEGNGKGLALCALALKTAGIPPSALQMEAAAGKTSFRLRVAPQLVTQDVRDRIERELLAEVEAIPPFPEHVTKIIALCESPESDARQISREMEQDAAIVSEMLKLANSGGFAGGRVAEVHEAVTIIGLRNISGLMLKIGAFQILEGRYAVSDEMRDHPIRVAFYARELAKKFKMAGVAEQVYAGGLLHDIGRIVLMATMKNPEAFLSLSQERDRRTQLKLEEVQCGVGHAEVGGLLAEKWKFPDNLREAILLHHTPHACPAEARDHVYLVYLANMMADAQKGYVQYFAIEPDVLARFNLTTEDGFNMLAAALSASYRAS